VDPQHYSLRMRRPFRQVGLELYASFIAATICQIFRPGETEYLLLFIWEDLWAHSKMLKTGKMNKRDARREGNEKG
jgi:hypothetical protein